MLARQDLTAPSLSERHDVFRAEGRSPRPIPSNVLEPNSAGGHRGLPFTTKKHHVL